MSSKFVRQVRFQLTKLPGPDILIRPPGSAMPLFVVEGAEIARVQDGDSVGETKRDDLIRSMMQGITGDSFHFLAGPVSGSVEALASPGSGFRSTSLLPQLGLRFGATLLDRTQASTRHG